MLATPFPTGPLFNVVFNEDACLRIGVLLGLHVPPDEINRKAISFIFIEVNRLRVSIAVRGRCTTTVSEDARDCRFKEHY